MNTDLNRIPISRVGGWYLLVLLSLVSRCVLFSNENDFMASYFASPVVVFVILKKIWYSASTLLCTFVLVFSTKLFTCALRRQIWVFSCTLTFSMRPGCALFRNGPVREVARYPLFFCYAPLPGLDSNKLKSNPRSAAQHDTLIANPIAFPIHNLIILY